MKRVNMEKKELLKLAEFLDAGYYRVKENGEFVECNARGRKIFGIPSKEKNLSRHSIADLYIFPEERKSRLEKLNSSGAKPLSGTLKVRIDGKTMLLFDQCWLDDTHGDEGRFTGLISPVMDKMLFPNMSDEFPMGLYELDNLNRIVRFNKKTMEIFGYKERDNLIGKNISEYYADLAELQAFSEKVKQDGFAHDILRLKDANDKIMELECFTEHINEFKKARWGILIDVTKRERYYRALDRMPTGYYRIRYDKKEADKHVGRIEHCNDQFARILGVEDKETLIGQDVRSFYASVDEGKEYLRFLEMLDKGGAPVQGHPLRIKRADNGQIVHISIDSQLVRENGEVIGREGTIRDITEKVELEKKVKETESRLKKTTADINNLIHTFLHPVLKFYGHSELLDTLGRILYKSARHRVPAKADLKKLAKQLEDRLLEIQNRLDTISETGSDSAAALARTFEKIINGFDYSVDKAENSNILLDKVIRDTALWVLEELDLAGYFNENLERGTLPDVFDGEFIQFLENILFEYIIRTAGILKGETQVMRREAEALRKYIGLGEKRRHTPRRQNLGKIIEENIELFKPLFLQKDIEIEYRPSGNLYASISENDIDRVVCNLLYNAKKYSYEGPGCVVRVRTRNLHRENAVELIISNLGTPIKRDEIESGKIFKFGYRSKLVYRTDRDGTGVGLADAWDVIHEHHGGTITITSEPAGSRDDGDPPRYRVPYITTVTVRLPVHRG